MKTKNSGNGDRKNNIFLKLEASFFLYASKLL